MSAEPLPNVVPALAGPALPAAPALPLPPAPPEPAVGGTVPEALALRPEGRTAVALWLTLYWCAAGLGTLFLLLSGVYLAVGAVSVTNVITVALATCALYLGAGLATRLFRLGAGLSWFARGTVTTRSLSVGWVLLILVVIGGGILAALLDLKAADMLGSFDGLLGTIGAVALLAVLGPGYGEYREARDETLTSRQPH
ncbi:hypothetical protein [Naasia sp. SYSU D00057]|uniref:hypothetical protein n=1 Tax=Naasia sp. SYSU D00057 TaxID=2817380 RepID=UPI001B30BE21|nr:hypothetical protein [Naasia sp. SYSU D00057]